jgi:hypothetical protein
MENIFISPNSLPFLVTLKKERENRINNLINIIKIHDVREDASFEKTTLRIKNEILLPPIIIGEGKFINYEFREIPLSFNQQVLGMGNKNHYLHQVEFPFTGSKELFSHIPETGFSYSSSDRGIILPGANYITVIVDLPEINPQKSISEANNLLNMTLQFVNGNNLSIQSWNTYIEQKIDNELTKKREALMEIFGN